MAQIVGLLVDPVTRLPEVRSMVRNDGGFDTMNVGVMAGGSLVLVPIRNEAAETTPYDDIPAPGAHGLVSKEGPVVVGQFANDPPPLVPAVPAVAAAPPAFEGVPPRVPVEPSVRTDLRGPVADLDPLADATRPAA